MFTEMTTDEMEVKDEENQIAEDSQEDSRTKEKASEISEPRWSVVTYESVAVRNLTYDEALEWVKRLDSQKTSGLCIITDEAAARINNGSD